MVARDRLDVAALDRVNPERDAGARQKLTECGGLDVAARRAEGIVADEDELRAELVPKCREGYRGRAG